MKAAAYTKASAGHPNEDSFLVDQDLKLFGVFDGVGGYEGGENAAKIAARVIGEIFKNQTFSNKKQDSKIVLEKTLIAAAEKIAQDGQKNNRPYQATTGAIAAIKDNIITIACVGDSRCYGLTKSEKLERLSIDHNMLQQLVDNNQISKEVASKIDQAKSEKELLPQDVMIFNKRHIITSAISAGFTHDGIHFNQAQLSNFKMLILTTDGVHDNVTDEEIKTLLTKNKDPKQAVENIVEEAHKVSLADYFRSKPDDITAVVVKI